MEIIDLCDQSTESAKLFNFVEELEKGEGAIQFKTSGSTGSPKVILFSRKQIAQSARLTANTFGLSGKSTLLCPFSLDYVAGKMMVARAWHLGAKLLFTGPKRNPYQYLSGVLPDFVAMVPMQLLAVIESELDLEQLNKAKNVIIGGAPFSNELEQLIVEKVQTPCYQTFGMTETLTHFAIRDLLAHHSEFKLLKDVSIRVDQRSCLSVLTPLSANWLQTNDVVELTSGGFKWKGRHDLVINSGGVKIHPEKVERVLSDLYSESTLFISEIESSTLGSECVMVLSERRKIEKVQMAAVLEPYEIPRKLLIEKDLPTLQNGKIDRAGLRVLCKTANSQNMLVPIG